MFTGKQNNYSVKATTLKVGEVENLNFCSFEWKIFANMMCIEKIKQRKITCERFVVVVFFFALFCFLIKFKFKLRD